MSMPAAKKIVSPKLPSQAPNSSDMKDINLIISEIDELMKKQTSSENKRQEALATTTAAHREIDLAQDLLHTSLQRIANVDDGIFHARAVLSTKEEALNKVKTKKTAVSEKRQALDKEAAELQKILDQQNSLVVDLQRKLLQAGITPENILKLQKEARDKARHIVASTLPPNCSRSKQESKEGKPKSRRKMKFPLFGKAT